MVGGEDAIEADSLTFVSTNRHRSGVYVCSADNGYGNDPVATEIRLDVQRK